MTDAASEQDQAVAASGAYDVICRRLETAADTLATQCRELNQQRCDVFGQSVMEVIGRSRIRTENNCIARDLVRVGDQLLLGYNLFLGLKKDTKATDVFALFQLHESDDGFTIEPVSEISNWLSEPRFNQDFNELYAYYRNAELIQLQVKNNHLYATFKIGERLDDIRVFRWRMGKDDGVELPEYVDNRGERDVQPPSKYDFEWHPVGRDQVIEGRHPHYNILDKVFVETIGGDLTIKVENNTEDGLGIYREPVEDTTQSLGDAEIAYAEAGGLLLLKIQPYREEKPRFLVFNALLQQVLRIDAVGHSCLVLPEDHGIIFPGGYYLSSGEFKTFEQDFSGYYFKNRIRSPNGEDELFVFYEPEVGHSALFAYNLVNKSLYSPLYGHGYAFFGNGRLALFNAEKDATRVHPLQIWQTPFTSDEHHSQQPLAPGFWGNIGNSELVRGLAELFALGRLVADQTPTARIYHHLINQCQRLFDSFYWLAEPETGGVADTVHLISATAEQVLDEFEKVEAIRAQARERMASLAIEQQRLLASVELDLHQAPDYLSALQKLRRHRGALMAARELRYVDTSQLHNMEEDLATADQRLADATVNFLREPAALAPYRQRLSEAEAAVAAVETGNDLQPWLEKLDDMTAELDVLSEMTAALKVDDATLQTQLLDQVGELFALLNQAKARLRQRLNELRDTEAVAQFSAQFKLLSQQMAGALSRATNPDACDGLQAQLFVQLEELESRFGEHDNFLADLALKRDEITEAFDRCKQQLLDERQAKIQAQVVASKRLLESVQRRCERFAELEQLHTFFAADPLVDKLRQMADGLRALTAAVQADDLDSQLKSIQDQALRTLRDSSDLFEEGGKVIRLGSRHKFSVNRQALDLSLLEKDGVLHSHLTGTDYFEPLDDADLAALKDYWRQSLVSENGDLYRAEYLAAAVLAEARDSGEQNYRDFCRLLDDDEQLLRHVSRYAGPRYAEGYEKGIHDHDACYILQWLVPVLEDAGLLAYAPDVRGLAMTFWAQQQRLDSDSSWPKRAQSAQAIQQAFGQTTAIVALQEEIANAMQEFFRAPLWQLSDSDLRPAAAFLIEVMAQGRLQFPCSDQAEQLQRMLQDELKACESWRSYRDTLDALKQRLPERWHFVGHWLQAMVDAKAVPELERYIPEAIALELTHKELSLYPQSAQLDGQVKGLLGEHSRLDSGSLTLSIDDFVQRLEYHKSRVEPGFKRYQLLRQEKIQALKKQLRLTDFSAKPLTSFVRNQLINDVYLPLIGDNLAKQMGTVGESKRTDLMGLLMMISPPGYGKTTLMEYVANRLGLIFVRINCPVLGHEVTSLDPQQAPNSAAAQELGKLNLAFEMGNNVMLYLDDIQHTAAEFLQKFIALCDGTRRVEGVWRGASKSYDLRGKKFCIVMAGNPYTESGDVFQIPDMLANRADIYNLGEVLGGREKQFSMSYIENCLTSNAILAPLANRPMTDLYQLVGVAEGSDADVDIGDLSGAEIQEMVAVLKHLLVVQKIVLSVNRQYIESAAQDDRYRVEPPFKLQGSYRNMNKMAEKISAVMNNDELTQLIDDHYLGEAQLLTQGTEENLLKLAELRDTLTGPQRSRWQEICSQYKKRLALGDEDDPAQQVARQLIDIADHLQSLHGLLDERWTGAGSHAESNRATEAKEFDAVAMSIEALGRSVVEAKPQVHVVNQPLPGMQNLLSSLADTIETSLLPVVKVMEGKLDLDLRTHQRMTELAEHLRLLRHELLEDESSDVLLNNHSDHTEV